VVAKTHSAEDKVAHSADHAGAEDDRGSLVAIFRAIVHSVTIHPIDPRESFEFEVRSELAVLIREMHSSGHATLRRICHRREGTRSEAPIDLDIGQG